MTKTLFTILSTSVLAVSAYGQNFQVQEQTNQFNPSNFNAVEFNPSTVNLVEVSPSVSNFNAVNTAAKSVSKSNSSSTSSATGGHANSSIGNIAVDASSVTANPDVTVNTDYTDWKRFQLFERPLARSRPGATVSPLDTRSVVPTQAPTLSPDARIQRYHKYLMEKGIYPNTIGNATIVNGKMEVPLSK